MTSLHFLNWQCDLTTTEKSVTQAEVVEGKEIPKMIRYHPTVKKLVTAPAKVRKKAELNIKLWITQTWPTKNISGELEKHLCLELLISSHRKGQDINGTFDKASIDKNMHTKCLKWAEDNMRRFPEGFVHLRISCYPLMGQKVGHKVDEIIINA